MERGARGRHAGDSRSLTSEELRKSNSGKGRTAEERARSIARGSRSYSSSGRALGCPAQGSPQGRAPPNSLGSPPDNYGTALTPRAQFRAPFLHVREGFFLPRVHGYAPAAYGHSPSIFGVRNLKDGFGFTFVHTLP